MRTRAPVCSTSLFQCLFAAILERLRRLAKQISRTRAESAETRQLVEAVQRKIARARQALKEPELVQIPANRSA